MAIDTKFTLNQNIFYFAYFRDGKKVEIPYIKKDKITAITAYINNQSTRIVYMIGNGQRLFAEGEYDVYTTYEDAEKALSRYCGHKGQMMFLFGEDIL